jgi:translocator protein
MKLLFWLALSFLPALIGRQFQPGNWYENLVRAPWTPPNLTFPIVWTCLYALMGVSAWLVFRDGFADRRWALALFLFQLVLNGLWSWLFFGQHWVGLALVELIVLWFVVLATLFAFWSFSLLAGGLMIPYLLWLTIAISLNGYIWKANPLL